MLTTILLHPKVFRLDYHANRYLARISTTPASHRPHHCLRHRRPTRSTRRHAHIRIQTGPDVLPLVDLPHDRSGPRFRRAVPIKDQRLHVLALADRSLLNVVACGVCRDAHPDQVSRGESLLCVLPFPLGTYQPHSSASTEPTPSHLRIDSVHHAQPNPARRPHFPTPPPDLRREKSSDLSIPSSRQTACRRPKRPCCGEVSGIARTCRSGHFSPEQ